MLSILSKFPLSATNALYKLSVYLSKLTLPILEISTTISPVLSALAFKFPSITISLST